MRTCTPAARPLHALAFGLALMLAAPAALRAQATPGNPGTQPDPSMSGALYDELARMDSLVFDAGFVRCDAQQVNTFFADDVEFYHDQTGFASGQQVRDDFRKLTESCPAGRGITRRLVPGSLRVYPIHDYGAVQMGLHRFVPSDGTAGSIARFVHLWRKKDGAWKITRVLSFDHREADAATDPN